MEDVEKGDIPFLQCIYKNMDHANLPNTKKQICDAVIFESIESEIPVSNSSLLHNVPLNTENGIPYNDRDFLVTGGYHKFLDSITEGFQDKIILEEKSTVPPKTAKHISSSKNCH